MFEIQISAKGPEKGWYVVKQNMFICIKMNLVLNNL